MRFFADRTIRHRPGLETLDDRLHRLHFLNGNSFARVLEFHQAPQGRHLFGLIVDELCVFFERGVIVVAARLLQEVNRLGVEQMQFPVLPILVLAVSLERMAVERERRECPGMLLLRLQRDLVQADASDPGWRPGEVFVDQLLAEADRLEDLRATVGLNSRYPHLGHYLYDAFDDGLDVAFDRVVVGDVLQHPFVDHVIQTLEGQVRIDGLGTIADQQTEVVHLTRLSRLEHQACTGASARADEVMMEARCGQQGRNRGMSSINPFV